MVRLADPYGGLIFIEPADVMAVYDTWNQAQGGAVMPDGRPVPTLGGPLRQGHICIHMRTGPQLFVAGPIEAVINALQYGVAGGR